MSVGVVQSVTPVRAGGTLTADTASGDTVLLLDDAADFAEDAATVARWLVIGDDDTPRRYGSVANDDEAQESVTLSSTVGAVFEAGTPVTVWDPEMASEDKRVVNYKAAVRLDGAGSVSVLLKHTQVQLAGAQTLVGARVSLEETSPGVWEVADVHGREPQIVGVDADGNPAVVIGPTGLASFTGEIGTAPPDEPGVFMFSLKDSRFGVQYTQPTIQFSVGASVDQPSIQAFTTGGSGLYLYSARPLASARPTSGLTATSSTCLSRRPRQ